VIDQQLQQALDVDPSPEFFARVRRRIADEPSPRSLFALWPTAMIAVGAAAVVLAVLIIRSQPHTPPAGGYPIILASRQLAAEAPAVAVRAPARRTTARSAPRARVVASTEASEVLISTAESRAIRALIAGVRDGRIDPRSLPPDPQPPSDIIIPPIVVAPIPASSIGEGVRQ
jgi:hypothetical protein